jgi:hypothetical protein
VGQGGGAWKVAHLDRSNGEQELERILLLLLFSVEGLVDDESSVGFFVVSIVRDVLEQSCLREGGVGVNKRGRRSQLDVHEREGVRLKKRKTSSSPDYYRLLV